MFYSLIFFISILCTTTFSLMKHPLAMGLMLLIQTFLVCFLSGLMTKTFWFSYTLFLIFLGGMLVLFIYVTSLASNEMFIFSSKTLIIMLFLFFFMNLILILFDKTFFMNYLLNYDSTLLNMKNNLTLENSLMLNKLYNFPINIITILLMMYLFLTLIAVVKITNIFEGPLRPKN